MLEARESVQPDVAVYQRPPTFDRDEIREELRSDYTTESVPISRRRSQLHMTLLWITANTGFFSLYTGYTLRQGNLSFAEVLAATVLGNVVIGLYWLGACYIGARLGQTETLLARSYLGRYGSFILSALLLVAGVGWYSFQANLLAVALTSLLGIPQWLAWLSLACGLVMMVNNLLGFTSVSVWAKYVTAPVVILWVLWAFSKAFLTTKSSVLFAPPAGAATLTIGVAASAILGNVSWGNEPDVWRWARPTRWVGVLPTIVTLIVGNGAFVMAGFVLAEIQNIQDYGKVIQFVTQYTIGIGALAVVIMVITQIAVNDLNLYEAVTGLRNFAPGRRWVYVLILGTIGAVMAYFQILNFYITLAILTGILVPSVTVLIMLDRWIVPRVFGLNRHVEEVPGWKQLAAVNVPGIVALVAAVVVGGLTGGVITPFGDNLTWGMAALNAWVTAAIVYFAGIALLRLFASGTRLLRLMGYSQLSLRASNA